MTFLTNENFPYIALKTQPWLAHQQSTPKCLCRTQFFWTLSLNTEVKQSHLIKMIQLDFVWNVIVRNVNDIPHKLWGMSMTFRTNCEECHWHSSQTKTSLTLRWKLNRGLHTSRVLLSVHAAPNFFWLWFLILRWIKATSSKRFNLILCMACCHKNMTHLHAWFCEECPV